jgi:hypothetical protein
MPCCSASSSENSRTKPDEGGNAADSHVDNRESKTDPAALPIGPDAKPFEKNSRKPTCEGKTKNRLTRFVSIR